jgi:hypothetical protein
MRVRKKEMGFPKIFLNPSAVDPCQDGNNGGCSDFCKYTGPGTRTCVCDANTKFATSSTTDCVCFDGYSEGLDGVCRGKNIFHKFFTFFNSLILFFGLTLYSCGSLSSRERRVPGLLQVRWTRAKDLLV